MADFTRDDVVSYFQSLQDDICASLQQLDGEGEFREDRWQRPEGGGGRSRVITGRHIEKGGVNFSAVHGDLPARISSALGLPETDFFATGVSIVLHPSSPLVPIIHMNVRYFETTVGKRWFGGGIDVTPHYINRDDASFFHSHLKEVCDRHHSSYYPRFKEWADEYFYIPHRQETRGIGGIFFDRLEQEADISWQDRFAFVQDVGNAFVPIYSELMTRHRDETFTDKHRSWQLHRRGRYVEFNLVWDKGTKFGLQTNGRIESILMSMPPMAQWTYDLPIESGSNEERTLSMLKKGVDWIRSAD